MRCLTIFVLRIRQPKILAAERHDAEIEVDAAHGRHPAGVETGADGHELRLELALCSLDRDLRRPLLDTNDLDAAKDSAPAPPDLLHHGPRDGG
jgi:hypothetical protein